MGRIAQTLARLAAYAAGGLLASLVASMLVASVDMYVGVDVRSPWFLVLGALVGITSGIGLELDSGQQQALAGRAHPTLWPWLAAVGVGMAGGALLAPQPWSSSAAVIAVVAILALALVNGLAVETGDRPGAFNRSLVALALSLAAGIAFAAAGGTVAILSRHPCPPHGFCLLELPPGSVFVGMATLSLPVALWLGLASWLALGLGVTLQPRSWQQA